MGMPPVGERHKALKEEFQLLKIQSLVSDLSSSDRIVFEDGLVALSRSTKLTPPTAADILDRFVTHAGQWVKSDGQEPVVDPDLVIKALSTPLAIFKDSNPRKNLQVVEDVSSDVIVSMLEANPSIYADVIDHPNFQSGVCGDYNVILSKTLGKLSQSYRTIPGYGLHETNIEIAAEIFAAITDRFIKTNDQELIEKAKSNLPPALMTTELSYVTRFPEVYALAKDIEFDGKGKISILAEGFLNVDADRELLKKRILREEFGNPTTTLSAIIAFLASERNPLQAEQKTIEDVTKDLWVELLGINRTGKKVKEIRKIVMEKPWYWEADGDLLVYTAVETLDGLNVPVGKEQELIDQCGELIFAALVENNRGWQEDDETLRRIWENRDTLKPKLAIILKKIRESEDGNMFRNFSDSLLITCLDPQK